jgi:hypothetical protein
MCYPLIYNTTQREPELTVTVAPESIVIGPVLEAFLVPGSVYEVVTFWPFSTNT